MASMTYSPVALRAYLAGRQLAHLMSVDSETVAVPAEHEAERAAYLEGIADEQANAPLPATSVGATPSQTAAPPPPKQKAPPALLPASVSAAQKRRLELRRFLESLKQQPVETVRAVAEAQILRVEGAFKSDAPYFSRTLQPEYTGIKARLAGARGNLVEGDGLRKTTDVAAQTERRNLYMRAYTASFSEGEALAATVGDESFLVLTLANVVIPAAAAVVDTAAQASKAVLQAGKEVAQEVGHTARNVGYVLAAGAAFALIAFGSQRGKRK